MPDTYTLKLDGIDYKLNWDRPNPPTQADIDPILSQLRANPSHQQDAFIAPRDPDTEGKVAAYTSQFLKPGHVPFDIASKAALSHPHERYDAIQPDLSEIGKIAVMRFAWQKSGYGNASISQATTPAAPTDLAHRALGAVNDALSYTQAPVKALLQPLRDRMIQADEPDAAITGVHGHKGFSQKDLATSAATAKQPFGQRLQTLRTQPLLQMATPDSAAHAESRFEHEPPLGKATAAVADLLANVAADPLTYAAGGASTLLESKPLLGRLLSTGFATQQLGPIALDPGSLARDPYHTVPQALMGLLALRHAATPHAATTPRGPNLSPEDIANMRAGLGVTDPAQSAGPLKMLPAPPQDASGITVTHGEPPGGYGTTEVSTEAGPSTTDRQTPTDVTRETIPTAPKKAKTKKAAAPAEAPAEVTPEPEPHKPSSGQLVIGDDGVTLTPKNTPVPHNYAVVPATDLLTSHTDNYGETPGYDQRMQDRDRGRAASQAQIAKIKGDLQFSRVAESPTTSEGAPLVGSDLHVESGNARTMAIRQSYAEKTEAAARYKTDLLANADKYGLDPEHIKGIDNPILIRLSAMEHARPEARAAFAREAGEQTVANRSAPEVAANDARNVRESGALQLYDPGFRVGAKQNLPFVQKFMEGVPQAEHPVFLTDKGELTAAGVQRIRYAVLRSAYDDPTTIARLVDDPTPEVKNIGNAMEKAAPAVARLKEQIAHNQAHDFDISKDITDAANRLAHLKRTGRTVEEELAQTDLMGEGSGLSTTGEKLLKIFDNHGRSATAIGKIIENYHKIVESVGSPHQIEAETRTVPTKAEVLEGATRAYEGAAASEQPDLFGQAEPDSNVAHETAGAKSDEAAPSDSVRAPRARTRKQKPAPDTGDTGNGERAPARESASSADREPAKIHEGQGSDHWQAEIDRLESAVEAKGGDPLTATRYDIARKDWHATDPGNPLHEQLARAYNERDGAYKHEDKAALSSVVLSKATKDGPVSHSGLTDVLRVVQEKTQYGTNAGKWTSDEVGRLLFNKLLGEAQREGVVDSRAIDEPSDLFKVPGGRELVSQWQSLLKDLSLTTGENTAAAVPGAPRAIEAGQLAKTEEAPAEVTKAPQSDFLNWIDKHRSFNVYDKARELYNTYKADYPGTTREQFGQMLQEVAASPNHEIVSPSANFRDLRKKPDPNANKGDDPAPAKYFPSEIFTFRDSSGITRRVLGVRPRGEGVDPGSIRLNADQAQTLSMHFKKGDPLGDKLMTKAKSLTVTREEAGRLRDVIAHEHLEPDQFKPLFRDESAPGEPPAEGKPEKPTSLQRGTAESRQNDILDAMQPGKEYTAKEIAESLGRFKKSTDFRLRVLEEQGKVKSRPLSEEEFEAAAEADPTTEPADTVYSLKDTGSVALHSGIDLTSLLKPLLGEKRTQSVKEFSKAFKDAVHAGLSPSSMEGARTVANSLRDHLAQVARKYETEKALLDHTEKEFDRMQEGQRLAFIDGMETGGAQASPELQAVADIAREALRLREEALISRGLLRSTVENFFPHLWENPDRAEAAFATAAARRPLAGSEAFRKQRTIATTAEGIALGLKPVTTNPILLMRLKFHEIDKSIMAHDFFEEMKRNGEVQFVPGTKAPPGFAEINDKIAHVTERRETTRADGSPGAPEYIRRGMWVAPENAARIINNHLSPGWGGKPLYQAVAFVNNSLNMAQLGMSGFHASVVGIDAVVSDVARGIVRLSKGNVVGAARAVAGAPLAPVTRYLKGRQVLSAYLGRTAPAEVMAIADAVVQAGGRASLDHVFRLGSYEKFGAARRAGDVRGMVGSALPAILEGSMAPLMREYVPKMKLGVFASLAEDTLAELPASATLDEKRAALAPLWDSVDNRMGQLAYDNLFWNRTFKDIGHIATRSLGWNLGTIREIGGGVKDTLTTGGRLQKGGPLVTHKMGYIIALPAVTAIMGAIFQYLHTGKGPQELLDYFHPKDGKGGRVTFPTYMRDVEGYSTDPGKTALHKVSPIIGLFRDLMSNEDFHDQPIRNANDPAAKQVQEYFNYLSQQVIPISFRPTKKGVPQAPIGSEQFVEQKMGVVPYYPKTRPAKPSAYK